MDVMTDHKDPYAEAMGESAGEAYQFAIHAMIDDDDKETFTATSNIRDTMSKHIKLLTSRSNAGRDARFDIKDVLTIMGTLPSTQGNPHPLVTWEAIKPGMTDGADFMRPLSEGSQRLVADMKEVKDALDRELGRQAASTIPQSVAARHWNSIIDQSISWLDRLTTEALSTHKEVMQEIGHVGRDQETEEFSFEDPHVLKKLRGKFTQYMASRSAYDLYEGLVELSRSKIKLLCQKWGASNDAEVKRLCMQTKEFQTDRQLAEDHLKYDRVTNQWLADVWNDWLGIDWVDAREHADEGHTRVSDIADYTNPLTWAIHADKCKTLDEFIYGIPDILELKSPEWARIERLEREARAAESGVSVTAESLKPADPESTVPAEGTPEKGKKKKKNKSKKKKTGTSTAATSSKTADASRVAETEEDDKSLARSVEDEAETSGSAQLPLLQDPAILAIRGRPSAAPSDVPTKDIPPGTSSNPVEEAQPEQSILDRLFNSLRVSSHGTSLPSHRDIQLQDPDSTTQETTLVRSEASTASGSGKQLKTSPGTSRGGKTMYLPPTKPKETRGDSAQAATASSVGKYIPPHKWKDARRQSAEQEEKVDVTTHDSVSRGPTADWFPSRLAATTRVDLSGKRYHNDGIWSPLIDYGSWAEEMDDEHPIG